MKEKLLSAICAVLGALICGLLGSGVFDGMTGSGLPNPGGAVGARMAASSDIAAGGAGVLLSRHPARLTIASRPIIQRMAKARRSEASFRRAAGSLLVATTCSGSVQSSSS